MCQFDNFQLKEIEKGKEFNLDVSVYSKPEYTAEKMWYIRNLMMRNIDYTPILHLDEPEISAKYKELKHKYE